MSKPIVCVAEMAFCGKIRMKRLESCHKKDRMRRCNVMGYVMSHCNCVHAQQH